MRGVRHTPSRLPAVRALIAGAAFLAGAVASVAHAGATGSVGTGNGEEETAFAVPRVVLPGRNDAVAFPQPLGPGDAAVVRRVFVLQRQGRTDAAQRVLDELGNTLLLGDVLADRYLGRHHRASAGELSDWMRRFQDRPDAPAIHQLLLRRLPRGAAAPLAPRPTPDPATELAGLIEQVPLDAAVAEPLKPRPPPIDNLVIDRAARGNTSNALHWIASRYRHPGEAAAARGALARALFTRNADTAVLQIAHSDLQLAPAAVRDAVAPYVGGLAAWRLGHMDQAATLFHAAAATPSATARQSAAAALWAARAAARLNQPDDAAAWLRRAAAEPATLHGLLARRMLGQSTGTADDFDLVSQADVDAIAATTPGWRAFALLQVGEKARAEAELTLLWPTARNDAALQRSLALVAGALGMTSLAGDLTTLAALEDRSPRADLLLPLPDLRPTGGFRVDPALIYALARVESNFDADAVSPAGARGLLQLMPVTARYIVEEDLALARLNDASLNLQIGQRYLDYLAQQDGIEHDLLRMLAGYNAGPGNVARWVSEIRDHADPLLFIEALPNDETRHFVQNALTFTWLYAARLHLPAPSLTAMAAGHFPRFTPPADRGMMAMAAPRLH